MPDATEASLCDIDILWGFDQVKWWQMGPNEGCHLVCSPMGWEARGGREDEDDDYEHGTNDTAMLLQHRRTREEREELTPLVLIKRVSSEWEERGCGKGPEEESTMPSSILIPMLEGRGTKDLKHTLLVVQCMTCHSANCPKRSLGKGKLKGRMRRLLALILLTEMDEKGDLFC